MNNIGNKLINLRKEHHLSQEEAAEKLGVTRQTISKWETEESKPDFDKINLICNLYNITPNELFGRKKEESNITDTENVNNVKSKKAFGICAGIFFYFLATAWMIVSVAAFRINPVIAVSIFITICGIATFFIVYASMVYKVKKEHKKVENPVEKSIKECLAILTTIIYFVISFLTMAWHITWIIWFIYGLLEEIVKLIFMLKETHNEE